MSQPTPDPHASVEALLGRFNGYLRQAMRRHGLEEQDVSEVEQEARIRLWHALDRGALRPHESDSSTGTPSAGNVLPENLTPATASYVVKTVLSAVRDVLRRRTVAFSGAVALPPDHSPLVPTTPPLAERGLLQDDLGRAINEGLNRLAAPRRVAVRLHLSGYSRDEISRLLGWSEAKTRNLIYRGLHELREMLTHMGVTARGVSDGD